MSDQLRSPGCVVFSLDVSDGQAARAAAPGLFELFRRHGIAVTWGAGVYQFRCIARLIREHQADNELAILGDSSWVTPLGHRRKFYRQMDERVRAARDEHTRVTTLVLSDVDLCDHLDLLVKHKISMVRSAPRPGPLVAGQLEPKSSRFGVWQAPPAIRFEERAKPGWWADIKLRRTLKRCVQNSGILHLAATVDELVASPAGLEQLEHICQLVARLRQAGKIACLTLQQLAGQIQRTWQRQGLGSVLKAAA